ncbi:MAG: proton-conducting transporter membrane subunit [Candidatus Bathyarchaeia archaeon]|jgi:NADH-quinone oxidoreductase subunit N
MPITAFTLTLSLLALAGVPPLNGFMSKLVLFTAAIEGQMWWLALAGVLNSAFSMSYYGWVVKRMYFDDSPAVGRLDEPRAIIIALVIAAILIIVLGIYPGPVLDYLFKVANFLLSGV